MGNWEHIVSVWAIGALIAKMIAVVFLTGFARFKSQTPVAPEDRPETKGEAQSLFSAYDKSGVDRALAIHRNDLENIALFLLALFSLFLASGTKMPLWVLPVYIAIFVATRIIHTITYALALQPWRAIAFIIGLLDVVVAQGIAMIYIL